MQYITRVEIENKMREYEKQFGDKPAYRILEDCINHLNKTLREGTYTHTYYVTGTFGHFENLVGINPIEECECGDICEDCCPPEQLSPRKGDGNITRSVGLQGARRKPPKRLPNRRVGSSTKTPVVSRRTSLRHGD